jgi:hypothetical protein
LKLYPQPLGVLVSPVFLPASLVDIFPFLFFLIYSPKSMIYNTQIQKISETNFFFETKILL